MSLLTFFLCYVNRMHHNKMKEGMLEEGGPPPLVGFDNQSSYLSHGNHFDSKDKSSSSELDDVTISSEARPEQHMGVSE